ncbi:hypothetical protein RM705_08795 [Streptomyces sp. DSM 41636]|uniref:Protein kinase domain-containing protein n=1 Tax=Streptomyces edwardsiae TaxID=3075527 RepID=A0ABU2PRK9_9ACTN|nr:hypothetical protein [Streptomyces sp. DSM 41636]MDT0394796.1 hypothetical protein [Streptomyces sp. DSM 41636]
MSEPLRPSDPSRIAGFRLLRRLGAGGMGVVYLGRTGSGRLAAVKVIQAGGAADEDFRARFARETELARRVDNPWVVPVLEADADARTPWLATAFVPGPSLAEAVAAHGPLPPRAARVLGRCWPVRWPTSTRRGWCTVTSSPPMCCWRRTGRGSSTSVSRVPSTTPR